MPRTAPLLLTLALLVPISGLADPTSEPAGSGRVVLVPLNLGVRAAPEVEPGLEPVWQELVRHFELQDPRPASLAREGAAALWASVLAESTAEQQGDVYSAYARFARRLAEQVDYDTLVVPSLVTRRAAVHGEQVSWDGVLQLLDAPASIGGRPDGPIDMGLRSEIHGELGAASLHVAVLSPEGEIRHEGAGGLALLQRVAVRREDGQNEVYVVERVAPFSNPERLRKGIEAAFAHPLPASRAR